MKWEVRSESELYRDQWINVRIADVELPDGRHLDHRLIRVLPGAGAVVLNDRHEVLLLWRHRFITDAWNYEIPMGGLNAGEDPADGAIREVEEETGWRIHNPRFLMYEEPMNGLLDARNHIFLADEAVFVGPPTEGIECDRFEWVPLSKVPAMIANRDIIGGTTIGALLMAIHQVPVPG